MRKYEFVVVIKSTLSDVERKKLLDTIKSWIKDVKIASEKELGSKALAYKIKHELMGVYYQFELESETGLPMDFEKRLMAQDNVLRHLVLRTK
ncbi:MAG TPA: 30S ribosomal protein S6 [Candidatus Saccharimonadales bacterium]|nr:30S ribosomal protein S6 [Candidatus Saccharimonadales bacterium]HSW96850.1 30S ribosomal protein S6 [Candidatus Saccharimonadales bacterium]